MSNLAPIEIEAMRSILKGAEVLPVGMRRVMWQSRSHEAEAFALYNRHSGQTPMRPGCAPCHAKVYNWMLKQVLKP